jgi:hypothetical protein
MASPDVARMSEEPVVVRSRGWNLIFAGLRAFGALVCLLAATSGAGGVAGEVGFALLAAGTAAVAARGLRTGVYVWPAEVVVRNTFRTYHLPWDEIEEVGPPPRRRRFRVSLRSRGGKHVGLDGCWSPSQRQLERMASLIRDARPAAHG